MSAANCIYHIFSAINIDLSLDSKKTAYQNSARIICSSKNENPTGVAEDF